MIFINTDNSDSKNKIYKGANAGAAATKAEEKMKAAVLTALKNVPGFTTTKAADSKGYSIRLEVARVQPGVPDTKCSMSGSIVRYPRSVSDKQAEGGDEMVALGMTGNGLASGKSERAILDCIEAISEDLVRKRCIPAMRMDFDKRNK